MDTEALARRTPHVTLRQCRVCGGHEFSKIRVSQPKDWVLCKGCMALQTSFESAQLKNYVEANEGYGWGVFSPAFSEDLFEKEVRQKERRLHKLENLLNKKLQGRVLDFGSGTGPFLEALRRRGIAGQGIEPSVQNSQYSRSKGLEVHTGFLTPVTFLPQSFATINAENSLYYVPNLSETFRIFHGLLSPGGRLIWSEKDYRWSSLNPVNNLKSEGQVQYLSRPAIKNLLRLHGFELLIYQNRWGNVDVVAQKSEVSSTLGGHWRWEKLVIETLPFTSRGSQWLRSFSRKIKNIFS